MASRSNSSNDGDFEVVPRRNTGDSEFLSMSDAASGEGNPYEKRPDIIQTKHAVEKLLEKLHFSDENAIDELNEKLKSRDALDEEIVGEVANLETIVQNEEMTDSNLKNAAEKAIERLVNVRELALQNKTTVKRALDILEVVLPVFIRACEVVKDRPKLSGELVHLQNLYQNAMQMMLQHQQNFEMEQREKRLAEGKGLLERSISVAKSDHERVVADIDNEKKLNQLKQFLAAQSDVELMIGTESKELDVWLVSCRSDSGLIDEAKQMQVERYKEATKKYESRLKSINVNIDVNSKRQAELQKELERLKEEESRLKNNKALEQEVQKRATELDAFVLETFSSLQTKVRGIEEHTATAQEIILQMHECSSILLDTAIDAQKQKEERLHQLQIEALTRQRNVVAKAAVEFKIQIKMGEDNIQEYNDQINVIRKDIEKAAKRGQSLTVTKKRSELEEYQTEVEKEQAGKEDNSEKLEKMMSSLEIINGQLYSFGVTLPDVDALFFGGIINNRQDVMPSFREYRICMPLTVDEYKVGQLYMINKHTHEQSEKGEGVEVVTNELVSDEKYGDGFFTEKRVYLNSRLPTWLQSYIPKIFYVTEKAWNYYPYTVTQYTCSFVPRFSIEIRTCYKNDNGCTDNSLELDEAELAKREVEHLDIAYDELPEKYYNKEEDCRYFKSEKTGRGPLKENWRETESPIMCSYKLVKVNFEVWGLRERVQQYIQRAIKDILLVGHRQAFAWIDQWFDMTYKDVRDYEKVMQSMTNHKVLGTQEDSPK
eukprot:gene8859-9808_t